MIDRQIYRKKYENKTFKQYSLWAYVNIVTLLLDAAYNEPNEITLETTEEVKSENTTI